MDDAQVSSGLWLKTHSLDYGIVKVPVLDNPDLAVKLVNFELWNIFNLIFEELT